MEWVGLVEAHHVEVTVGIDRGGEEIVIDRIA